MIELYVRYDVQMPMGEISSAGIDAIRRYLGSHRLQDELWKAINPECKFTYLPPLPYDWEWKWVVSSGEYRGTLPKRVSKFYAKTHNIKLPDSILAELGNLARRHSSMQEVYHIEFVNRFDWQDGDFGDDGSCLWTYNAGGRMMIETNGGWAIRFYDDHDDGFARAWVVNVETDLYVVFNGYGLTTLQITRILAVFTGKTYAKISIRNKFHSQLFINDGNQGYIVGTPERIEGIQSWVFEWQPINYSVYNCYECGRTIEDDEVYVGVDDERYCESCFYEIFDTCSHCGETHYRDDLTYVESTGEDVCNYCLYRHFTTCNHCEEFFRINSVIIVGQSIYCRNCLDDLNIEGENIE